MRVLMCPPDFLRIEKVINSWMDEKRQPYLTLARRQWQNILKAYLEVGMELWFIEPEPECQDMCFSANAGWCRWGKVILSNFKGKIAEVRQPEVSKYFDWFSRYRAKLLNVEVIPFPEPGIAFEGQGDVVTIDVGKSKEDAIVLMGFGQNRTDFEAAEVLRAIHKELRVIPIRLVDSFFYHLDTACIFIPPKTFMYYPKAFGPDAIQIIKTLPADLIEIEEEDAFHFVCNGVFVRELWGKVAFITNKISLRLKARLWSRGIRVVEVYTTEFMKSGGSARCLTLFLPEEKDSS